jgi:hypothetical protein
MRIGFVIGCETAVIHADDFISVSIWRGQLVEKKSTQAVGKAQMADDHLPRMEDAYELPNASQTLVTSLGANIEMRAVSRRTQTVVLYVGFDENFFEC